MIRTHLAAAITLTIAACSGDARPTIADSALPDGNTHFARFSITREGVPTTYDLREGNGVELRCEQHPDAYVYTSFGDPAVLPQLDFDVHGFIGAGRYDKDAPADGPRLHVVWHGLDLLADSDAHSAGPCTLDLTRTGDTLAGEFRCAELRDNYGGTARTARVSDGSFRCALTKTF